MRREQQQHIQNRIGDFERRERIAIDAACWIENTTTPPTYRQFIIAVKTGTIKPRTKSAGGGYVGKAFLDRPIARATNIYDIWEIDPPQDYKKRDDARHAKMLAEHCKRWNKIWDRVLLSDAPEVLKLIEELEGGPVK